MLDIFKVPVGHFTKYLVGHLKLFILKTLVLIFSPLNLAAHCVENFLEDLTISVAEHDVTKPDGEMSYRINKVFRVIF